jgi:uncharacterized protein
MGAPAAETPESVDRREPQDPLEPWPPTIEWKRISARLIVIEEFKLLITVALVVVFCLGAWSALHNGLALGAVWLVVALAVVRSVLIVRAVRSWGYAERPEDLLVRHGVLIRRLSIVPYARMQFVDVTAGPLQRAFGLATVVLHTAAAASDARIPGLPGPEAARLRDRLAALGESRSEGL